MNLGRQESDLETWPITVLLPQAIEATIYSADLVEQIAARMAPFGFAGACLVADDGELVIGHARVLAANMLCRKTEPVIQRRMDKADRRGWRVFDEKWALTYLNATLEAIATEHPKSWINELLPWNFKSSS